MSKLEDVKGIGAKSVLLLNKLNIYSVDDLVMHYPFRYNILQRSDLNKSLDNDKVIIDGKIETSPILMRFKANLNKMNFRLSTKDGVVGISIFNRAFLKNNLSVGQMITVIGKIDKKKNVITASEVKLSPLSNKVQIEAIYHSTSGISNKAMSTYINMALLMFGNDIYDFIPDYLIKKYNFLNKKTALNIIHNPSDNKKLNEARVRLKYEEFFEFMFKINYLKKQAKKNNNQLNRNIDREKVGKFINNIGFELTKDQKKVVKEILDDLEDNSRMNRLLQGDVGSGKTIVAFIVMYANYLSGYQSALMAPTEILAKQHYTNLTNLFKKTKTNIKVEILTGSTTKSRKKEIYKDIKDGNIKIIIGTHALIQDDVIYNNLGLVITDEQHRFGVHQRANLTNKGIKPDVLYMSATPIPRTYALTIFGDMDTSILLEKPKNRKEIKTYIKSNNEIKDLLEMMFNELKQKHQIYVIAPLIEESDKMDLSNVNDLKEKMMQAFSKKYKIDIVHGKMSNKAKDLIMNDFSKGLVDILISTTVVEVGVDVPNATMMVIWNAERFGLSTLHQLRGRVGRSSYDSYCVLVSDTDKDRLKIMEKETDGFKIADADFKLRGHGDLFGTKQSGDMTFKIANIKDDYKILVQAKKDSYEYLMNKEYDKDELKIRLLESITKES